MPPPKVRSCGHICDRVHCTVTLALTLVRRASLFKAVKTQSAAATRVAAGHMLCCTAGSRAARPVAVRRCAWHGKRSVSVSLTPNLAASACWSFPAHYCPFAASQTTRSEAPVLGTKQADCRGLTGFSSTRQGRSPLLELLLVHPAPDPRVGGPFWISPPPRNDHSDPLRPPVYRNAHDTQRQERTQGQQLRGRAVHRPRGAEAAVA
jgi:hypothetical protein